MAELTIAFVDLTGSVSVFETLGNDRAARAVTKLTQWIGSVGLEHNGKVVKMLSSQFMAGPVTVQLDGRQVAMGRGIARKIIVSVQE